LSSSSLSTHSPTISSSSSSRKSSSPSLSKIPSSSSSSSQPTISSTFHPTRKESVMTTKPTSRTTMYPTINNKNNIKPSTIPTKLPKKNNQEKESWLLFFLKFIGWLIFLGLSMVLFGMCMSYRHHLYYFLLQVRQYPSFLVFIQNKKE
jgi:ATP-dependent Zn protease